MSALNITHTRIESGVLTFDVVAGSQAVDTFDLSLQFDPTKIQANSLTVVGPAGWTVLNNASGAGAWLVGGFSLNPVASGGTLATVSVQLSGSQSAMVWQYSGSVNDPAWSQPLTCLLYTSDAADE